MAMIGLVKYLKPPNDDLDGKQNKKEDKKKTPNTNTNPSPNKTMSTNCKPGCFKKKV